MANAFHKDLVGDDLHCARSCTGAGSPVGSVTPLIIGEFYFDTTSGILYVADGLTDTDWAAISGSEKNVTVTQSFTFATSSPDDFDTLKAGDLIIRAELEITTVFDDAATLVTLGLQTATGSILTSGDINPLVASTYGSDQNHDIAGADALRIQIVPGTSTQGAGRAIVTLRRA